MSDSPNRAIDVTLLHIENQIRTLDRKFDRLLIGGNGEDEGLLSRVARVEERQSRLVAWCGWLTAAGFAAVAWLLPGSYRTPQ